MEVSDNLPIYMFYKHYLKYGSCTRPRQSHMVQDVTSISLTIFRNQIDFTDWRPVFECTISDSTYDTFMGFLKKVYHNCFKLKEIKQSKKIRKPWLTNDCLQMIRKRDSLYCKFLKTKNPSDLAAFKKYRNFVTKFLRNAKNAYFEGLFSSCKFRSDIVWREINKLLNNGTSRNDDIRITLDNKTILGRELADHFNSYFTNLVSGASNVSREIDKNILGAPNANTAFFDAITPGEVYSTFMCLKYTRARDIYEHQIKPIKFVLDLLVPALSHIFNLCLSTGQFPKNMQLACQCSVSVSVSAFCLNPVTGTIFRIMDRFLYYLSYQRDQKKLYPDE